ncbi:MAG: hypothetical protein WCD70_16685 [Alphaproteobacteria bacterium]
MIGGISTVGASSGVVIPQVPSVPVAPNSASFASTLTSSPPAPGAVDTDDSFTPRVIQDPSAGFITQYLSANGSQVVSQTPSAITVAYLRQGLTAEGTTKQSLYAPVGTTA